MIAMLCLIQRFVSNKVFRYNILKSNKVLEYVKNETFLSHYNVREENLLLCKRLPSKDKVNFSQSIR